MRRLAIFAAGPADCATGSRPRQGAAGPGMSLCPFLLMAAGDNYLTIKSFQSGRGRVRLSSLPVAGPGLRGGAAGVSASEP